MSNEGHQAKLYIEAASTLYLIKLFPYREYMSTIVETSTAAIKLHVYGTRYHAEASILLFTIVASRSFANFAKLQRPI